MDDGDPLQRRGVAVQPRRRLLQQRDGRGRGAAVDARPTARSAGGSPRRVSRARGRAGSPAAAQSTAWSSASDAHEVGRRRLVHRPLVGQLGALDEVHHEERLAEHARRSARTSAPGPPGSRPGRRPRMTPNSSPLDVPNTPPCSTRTTNVPSSVSTRCMARECPTLRRATSRIVVGSPRCATGSRARPRSESPPHPSGNLPRKAPQQDVLGGQVVVELSHQHRAQRVAHARPSSASASSAVDRRGQHSSAQRRHHVVGVRGAPSVPGRRRRAVARPGPRPSSTSASSSTRAGGRIGTAIAGVRGQPDQLDDDLAACGDRRRGRAARPAATSPPPTPTARRRSGRPDRASPRSSSQPRRQLGLGVEVPARPPHRVAQRLGRARPTPAPGTTRTSRRDRS